VLEVVNFEEGFPEMLDELGRVRQDAVDLAFEYPLNPEFS